MSAGAIRKCRLTRVDRGGEWATWLDRSRSGKRASIDMLGRPGLWRAVRRNGGIETSFACPSLAPLEAAAMGEGWSLVEQEAALREWSRTTADQ